MHRIMNHPMNEIQFFFDLKILLRERNSLNNSLAVGFTSSLFPFFQPYAGTCNTLSIKAIHFLFLIKRYCDFLSSGFHFSIAIISFSNQLNTVYSLQASKGSLFMIIISISLPCSTEGFPNLSNK